MRKYTVTFYSGNYRARQRDANRDGADLYVEHHFNSFFLPGPDYCVAVVAKNASSRSIHFATIYTQLIHELLGCPLRADGPVIIGGFKGRGNGNLKHTKMPAVLLEPLFISNPDSAAFVATIDGREALAGVLVAAICEFLPDGGCIAFSVGHKGRTFRPRDRGAALYPGIPVEGNVPPTEADLAEDVLLRAAQMLARASQRSPASQSSKGTESER